MPSFTTDDLLRELTLVTSTSNARAMLGRASRVARVRRGPDLAPGEMLVLLEALATEGGAIQTVAEDIARRALAR